MTRSHHRLVPLVALVSQSIKEALAERAEETGHSVDHIVRSALAEYLQLQHGTLFQVSKGGALVEGLYRGEMTVGILRGYGDHGVGTFDGLDGELVVADGRVFQIRSDGGVSEAEDAIRTPFALITRFHPEIIGHVATCTSYGDLQRQLDAWRPSDHDFYAIRVEARFAEIVSRAVRPSCRRPTLRSCSFPTAACRESAPATRVSAVTGRRWPRTSRVRTSSRS